MQNLPPLPRLSGFAHRLAFCALLLSPLAATAQAADAANGKLLYQQSQGGIACANSICHGSNPAANLNSAMAGANNPDLIDQAVQNNAGGTMGAAVKFSKAQLADIAAFIANPDGGTSGQGSVKQVVEFYHAGLDNYFLTGSAEEAGALDANPLWGWKRSGNSFKSGGSTPVCRFYGSQSPGPNSHFYTVNTAECEYLKQLAAETPATQKRWNFEGPDFMSTPPAFGTCPENSLPVYQAYNNGASRGVDSNHRIASNPEAIREVVARGWHDEGVVMCAPR